MRLTQLCMKVAMCDRQDELTETEKRYIFRESDFTETDMEVIKARALEVKNMLKNSDGRKWKEVLPELKTIVRYVRLGFSDQDLIVETCRKNGISIEL